MTMRRLDTVWGQPIIELIITARHAWMFLNEPEGSSWTLDYDGTTYTGCRIRTHRPVDANYVRLTFTYKVSIHGTVPPATTGPQ